MFAAHHRLDRLVVLLGRERLSGGRAGQLDHDPRADRGQVGGVRMGRLGRRRARRRRAVERAWPRAVDSDRPSVVVARTSTTHGLSVLAARRRRPLHQARPAAGGGGDRRTGGAHCLARRIRPCRSRMARRSLELAREREEIVCLSGDLTRQCEVDLFRDRLPERFIDVGHGRGAHDEHGRRARAPGPHPVRAQLSASSRPGGASTRSSTPSPIPGSRCASSVSCPGFRARAGRAIRRSRTSRMMRALPNMTVIDVADAVEIGQVVPQIADLPGPVYLRLKRGEIPVIFDRAHDALARPGAGARRRRRARADRQRHDARHRAGCGWGARSGGRARHRRQRPGR